MLKYSLSLMPILFLVGLLQADELEKSEVNKVYVMKDKTIIFELKDDSYLKGNVLTSDCLRGKIYFCLLYTSPSPRDLWISRMPSSA